MSQTFCLQTANLTRRTRSDLLPSKRVEPFANSNKVNKETFNLNILGMIQRVLEDEKDTNFSNIETQRIDICDPRVLGHVPGSYVDRFKKREDFRKRNENGNWNEDQSDVRQVNTPVPEKSLRKGGIFGVPSLSRLKKIAKDHPICTIDEGTRLGAVAMNVIQVSKGQVSNIAQVYGKFRPRRTESDTSHTGENRHSGLTNDLEKYKVFAGTFTDERGQPSFKWTERNWESIRDRYDSHESSRLSWKKKKTRQREYADMANRIWIMYDELILACSEKVYIIIFVNYSRELTFVLGPRWWSWALLRGLIL